MKKKKNGAGRKKPASNIAKLILAAVTCVNLILSLLISLLHRQEIIHALENDEGVKVLLTTDAKDKETTD